LSGREDCVACARARRQAAVAAAAQADAEARGQVLVIERAGEFLFERRPATGIWSGLWSLPELPVDADVAETLRRRFGIEAGAIEALAPVVHGFTHFTLTLHPLRITVGRWARTPSPECVRLARDDAKSARCRRRSSGW
jgi:A/G-specific adenine glycosylase